MAQTQICTDVVAFGFGVLVWFGFLLRYRNLELSEVANSRSGVVRLQPDVS